MWVGVTHETPGGGTVVSLVVMLLLLAVLNVSCRMCHASTRQTDGAAPMDVAQTVALVAAAYLVLADSVTVASVGPGCIRTVLRLLAAPPGSSFEHAAVEHKAVFARFKKSTPTKAGASPALSFIGRVTDAIRAVAPALFGRDNKVRLFV